MPNLPTLTVSQAHFDRIVAAFPGDTATEKTAAYQAWLTNHLIDRVEQVEAKRLEEISNADKVTKLEVLRSSLPPRVQFPPVKPVAPPT